MPATLTTVNAILKEVYEGRIQDQLNDELILLKRVERSDIGITHTAGGKYVTFPLRIKRNSGIGSRQELEALPVAGQQGYTAAQVPLKYQYGRFRMSGPSIELANENFQAFSSALDMEMTGLKNDILKDQNRQLYNRPVGDIATTTTTTSGANTFTATAATRQYIEVGMVVDIYQSDFTTSIALARNVTGYVQSTGVATLDGATFSNTSGAVMVRQGSINRELNGLKNIVDNSSTLHNIAPGTISQWAAVVDANGGTPRALSEALMVYETDRVRVNGGKTSLIVCGLGVRRAYWALLVQQRRYTDTKEFAGGIQGLAFNNGREIPVVEDPDCPPNTMYFLDESSLTLYAPKDWSWLDREGHAMKWVNDYDAYEGVYHRYQELGTHQRNANAVLQDITEG